MALTADEQELFDLAGQSMPPWYADDARANEHMRACAKIFGATKRQIAHWLQAQAFILEAVGATADEPDWLGQHAVDRGTRRALGEGNTSLQYRLRNVPDAVTRPALLAAVQAIMSAAGSPGVATMIEMPRDKAYVGSYASRTGTGGTFAVVGASVMVFTPTVPFGVLPHNPVFPSMPRDMVFTGAASSGNNGTFETTGVVGYGAKYTNASGVAGVDATVSWKLQKRGVHHPAVVLDGWNRVYASRGYRAGSRLPTIIVILPYGTADAVVKGVREMLRQRRAEGVNYVVERREVP